LGDDATAGLAAAGAEIDDVVRVTDDIRMMFHDDESMSGFAQGEENRQQTFHLRQMQSGGGLVQKIERGTPGAGGEGGGQSHPLSFTAGKSVGRLADGKISQADFLQGLQGGGEGGDSAEELEGAIHRKIEHVRDGVASVAYSQGFPVITATAAGGAGGDRLR
jgi:hypothetical protein